jgi:hypothetical protein
MTLDAPGPASKETLGTRQLSNIQGPKVLGFTSSAYQGLFRRLFVLDLVAYLAHWVPDLGLFWHTAPLFPALPASLACRGSWPCCVVVFFESQTAA